MILTLLAVCLCVLVMSVTYSISYTIIMEALRWSDKREALMNAGVDEQKALAEAKCAEIRAIAKEARQYFET